jgi:hypothetical protein
MPTFRYDDDEPRTYPDLGDEVQRGTEVVADDNPDPVRFVEVPAETPAERKAREKAEREAAAAAEAEAARAAAEQSAGEGE